ncbi:hypothetical protein MUN82_13425 [Hymenobacter aerilatus]|uniref:DUF5672 domain-containing protein n=1 Tax=Hymenobacter aerilatus TaxID=2932251 RepID=A0A8T9SQ77_9BACT|nr:DUF5672 family protein [Hymenobacter aerilatus]UOR03945.1 hypothetical protein MUN82_13425 [Hymenobacter aerilatus]
MHPNLAVVIPIYKPYAALSASERKSLRRTYEVLGEYDIVFVTHDELDATTYYPQREGGGSVTTLRFARSYFTGLVSYSKLMLSLEFYQCFTRYDYLLVCQLDVYVFTDQLAYFTSKGYDYIGAPWFENFDAATTTSRITGVGNGGFSLRKVKSFLNVLYALELFSGRRRTWPVLSAAARHFVDVLRVAKHERARRTRAYEAALPWDTPLYEDGYWGIMVPQFFPWFRVASVEDATAFAFEVNPSVLYALNKQQLPMGTHAWEKYDPAFWTPFIK